ncbi:MAG: hypothetical protein RLY71_1836 [Pseudomonadota bacterium]|jgi:signal transduction histidine kinase
MTAATPSRRGRARALALVLTLVFVGIVLQVFQRYDQALLASAGPVEGSDWQLTQYQLTLQRWREVLRVRAAGGTVTADELSLRAELLISRTRLLTETSELTAFYQRIPAYPAAAAALRAFAQQTEQTLPAPLPAANAAELLQQLQALESEVIRLAGEVHQQEMQAREESLQNLRRHRRWLWAALGVAWVSVVAGTMLLACSRSRYRQVAQERLSALQAEQTASAALKDAIRAKNEFVGMVSHELRSPLQSIHSALDLIDLRRPHGTDPSTSLSPFIDRIRRAATALDTQLRDLLTLAQGEAGRLEMRPEPFEAVSLVDELIETWTLPAQQKGLTLTLERPDEPLFVVADPLRLSQVVTNLVSNAIKYTDSGGVSVRLSAPDRQTLHLSVKDTGPGIPAALLPQIFAAYRRFARVAGHKQSSGIGLAIVQTVVEHLGGHIEVDSQEGGGSEFRVTIPVVPVEDEPVMAPEQDQEQPLRLLIVDDRADVRESLGAVASELGCHCDQADGAATAANLLAARTYDVVLIDLNMPIKRGDELASETRRGDGPNQSSRLIAMSAADLDGVGQAWPFDGFLAKPVDRHALKRGLWGR